MGILFVFPAATLPGSDYYLDQMEEKWAWTADAETSTQVSLLQELFMYIQSHFIHLNTFLKRTLSLKFLMPQSQLIFFILHCGRSDYVMSSNKLQEGNLKVLLLFQS